MPRMKRAEVNVGCCAECPLIDARWACCTRCNTVITDYDIIPGWCPLPDVGGEVQS